MKEKENVFFVLPDLSAGGAERVVSVLARNLSQRGYRVSILVFEKGCMAYEIFEEVKIIEFGKRFKCGVLSKLWKIMMLFIIFLKNRGAVVIPFQSSCLRYVEAANILKRVKVIACERNDPYHMYNDSDTKKLMKKLFYNADYCVFQTKQASEYYFSEKEFSYSIIPNPISIPEIQWKKDMKRRRIVTFCRLTPQKNLHMAIDAMKILEKRFGDGFSFDVFGNGELKQELESYVLEQELEHIVKFHGITKNVTEEMSKSSVFILSSDYEGISNSMLEALSVGMPVVCTNCPIGGAEEMISSGENGLLIPVGNHAALADEITTLFENELFAIKLGADARKGAYEYSEEKITDCWEKVITSIS